MIVAADNPLTLTSDPAVPGPLAVLALAAVVLVVLTVWTYLGVQGATVRRVLTVLGLRLAALLLAVLALFRPSLAYRDQLQTPSVLALGIDATESMTILDEYGGQSRWQHLLAVLEQCKPHLDRLQAEQNVTVALHRFGPEVGDFGPQVEPDGKRSDYGEMLHTLFEKYRNERHLRGFLVLGDGADNGTRYPALAVAGQWRTIPCPVHTVAFGSPTTAEKQRDLALTALAPEPSPVPIKGELTVKATVDAPGFENARIEPQLLIDDKEVPADKVFINDRDVTTERERRLPLTTGNVVQVRCTAPSEPGEVKVTFRIRPLPGETSTANNEISTYLTVSKEGLSVLLVDKLRWWEPQLLLDALRGDPAIRLHVAWLRRGEPAGPELAELFQFDKRHYDVIILGDVTAQQVSGGDPQVFATLNRLVNEKRTGLLMMGGYASFGNSDWQTLGQDVAKMLPVELDATGQVDGPVKMRPTEEGLLHYVMDLAGSRDASRRVWDELPELNGMTRLGTVKRGTVTELARSQAGAPLLVGQQYGAGRVLAFGGDTTWRWRTSPEGVAHHARFWKKLVLWLAQQEEQKGSVVVTPDTRRLPAGGKLGFKVALRGKGGADAKEAQFEARVVGPDGVETPVPTALEREEERGTFWKTDKPGEYRLVVRGWGKEADGQEIPAETASVRFLVYQDEAELARRAADHDFLKKVAAAGGGRFLTAADLPRFLQELADQPPLEGRPKADLWPDWRRNQLSGFLVTFFLAFVALLSLEWFLRRRWGLV